MAKPKSPTWPYRIRISYLVLALSLLVNAVTIGFIVHINSKQADMALLRTAIEHSCDRDYNYIMSQLPNDGGRVLFSEGLCTRDAATGGVFGPDHSQIVNGHLKIN
jgi:hypothetical protein